MAGVAVEVSPPEDSDANEKPDDYDRVSSPWIALKRVVFFLPRVVKSVLLALWKRFFGPRKRP